MLKKIMILGTALMMCLAFASCDGDSSGDNGYSPEYNNDAEYRSNVNKAADKTSPDRFSDCREFFLRKKSAAGT